MSALTQRPAAQDDDGVLLPRRLAATQKLKQLGYHYDAAQGQWLPTQPAAQADAPRTCPDACKSPEKCCNFGCQKPAQQATPEPVQLDVVRQAIEERDAMESRYHELAKSMTYKGNSVAWWHSKATAYRNAIDEVWSALKAAGIYADGAKTCADGVRELAATPEPVGEPVGEPTEGEFFAWDPEGGHAFYKTQQEAIEHAEESLRYYLDGANDYVEWDEDVEQIRWGIVMQRAMASNIGETEDGESSCDYELQDVATRPAPGVPEGSALFMRALLQWAVGRWQAEVQDRPMVNKNRRTLDDTWRQVIRFAGGNPDALVGPSHDAMLAAAQAKGADHDH